MTHQTRFASAFGLERDPLRECHHLACARGRAARSQAALALHSWSEALGLPNLDEGLPWPDMRGRTHPFPADRNAATAMLERDIGGRTWWVAAFRDQSALVLHQDKPRFTDGLVRVLPWVFQIRSRKAGPTLMVRNPDKSMRKALFATRRPNGDVLHIRDADILRGNRLAVAAEDRLAADLEKLASVMGPIPAGYRPAPGILPEGRVRLDFLPYKDWSVDQDISARELAQDLADWLTAENANPEISCIRVWLLARLPEEDPGEPVLRLSARLGSGLLVRRGQAHNITRLRDLLPEARAANLVHHLGPSQGLRFQIDKKQHQIDRMEIAGATGRENISSHERLTLRSRFGTPPRDLAL